MTRCIHLHYSCSLVCLADLIYRRVRNEADVDAIGGRTAKHEGRNEITTTWHPGRVYDEPWVSYLDPRSRRLDAARPSTRETES